MHRVHAVGNLPGVRWELAKGFGSLPRWHNGVRQKKTKTRWKIIGAMELQPDDGPRSSLSIGSEFGRCSGISPKFARRFDEGIGKLARNTRDRRKKAIGLAAKMSKAVKFVG
ncbi:hypothetical protein BHE74_00052821, partial [Ensete ventricosum]